MEILARHTTEMLRFHFHPTLAHALGPGSWVPHRLLVRLHFTQKSFLVPRGAMTPTALHGPCKLSAHFRACWAPPKQDRAHARTWPDAHQYQ